MFPIECEIKKVRLEIDKLILENPSCSISLWDKKLIELTLKYSEREVAMYCPEFNKVDFCLKEDLKDKQIEILKIKCNTKQIEFMEYSFFSIAKNLLNASSYPYLSFSNLILGNLKNGMTIKRVE